MGLLNILTHYDGTTAWENILILLLAFVAGWLLHQQLIKRRQNQQYKALAKESEAKVKSAENELKAFKMQVAHNEKTQIKSLGELTGRVRSLEGDIRALSEERNKYHQQFIAKSDESKKIGTQIGDLEDQLKTLKEEKTRNEAEWTQKLKSTREELTRAAAWETRVRAAEDEAAKARATLGAAERRKLEAELRLKATSEYASKVVPLESALQEATKKYDSLEASANSWSARITSIENDLKKKEEELETEKVHVQQLSASLLMKDQHIADLQAQTLAADEVSSRLKTASAELELLKVHNAALSQEVAARQATALTMQKELELAKATILHTGGEKSGTTPLFSPKAPPARLHESSPDQPASL
jgi:chromosome segregation ATPase